jgi:signal transduction histidine kinase
LNEILHFKISSGLKNIIGRELITDKYIAVFELVKNSYDAGASKVVISFEKLRTSDAKISISDNGKGMDKADIINKWLFVAYSEKKKPSYRDSIKNRKYAGAKGVGRFSCDRLGANVELISKVANSNIQHGIKINWDDFEKDDQNDFASVNVIYDTQPIDKEQHGTTIVINNLREAWNRESLLCLKDALTQLVNPNATEEYDAFNIEINVPDELAQDNSEKVERKKVNGAIKNYIFDSLGVKTTKIVVSISADGKTIETILTDRGTHIFSMTEKSEYSLKAVSCTLYYLSRSAKASFRKIMGIDAVNYGSIFVYKNGFRVLPYGETERDFFSINQRKAQGYRRFFGTRELTGRIIINGNQNDLVETSSRNHGFIESKHSKELEDFFMTYVLRPLEKYVVEIIGWGNTDELLSDDALFNTGKNFDNLIKKLKHRTKDENIIKIMFNQSLIEIIESRKNDALSKVAQGLKNLAIKKNDDELYKAAKTVEKETHKWQSLVKDINEEKEKAQQQLEGTSGELAIVQKQVSLLKGKTNLTADEAVSALHIMKGYADAIDSIVDEIYDNLKSDIIDKDKMGVFLGDISRISRKIKNSYNLILNTKYSANTDLTHSNIIEFCKDYTQIVTGYNVALDVQNTDDLNINIKFNPLEFSIIIDNLLSNSQKANATVLYVSFKVIDDFFEIRFTDDGFGLSRNVQTTERIFESGYSTTGGTGIGLSTVAKYIKKIGGSIFCNEKYTQGFELIARLKI